MVKGAASCAPGRKKRVSGKLGRPTCLTEHEENALTSKGVDTRGSTDRSLAKKLRLRDVLRPVMPKEWSKTPRAWLSDIDIDAAMSQYSRLVPDFEYLGTVPVDFAEKTKRGTCVKMCSSKPFKRVFEAKKLGACVVNLDVHTGKGTHWVALAFDCRQATPRLLYYDSTGMKPPARWRNTVYAIIVSAIPSASTRRTVLEQALYNKTKHQKKNTECGVFAMMFIDALISGRSFEQYCSTLMSDEDAFKKRSIFYERPDGKTSDSDDDISWGYLLGR